MVSSEKYQLLKRQISDTFSCVQRVELKERKWPLKRVIFSFLTAWVATMGYKIVKTATL
jgi:thiamine pyrophosphokinase